MEGPSINEQTELRIACKLALVVLVVLTLVKPLGSIAFIGALGFTLAAGLQLYLPLWRADSLGLGNPFVGLHLRAWRRDLKLIAILVAITFPPFVLGHHYYITQAHDWAIAWGLIDLAHFIPHRQLNPVIFADFQAWIVRLGWLLQAVLVHTLGVALPEETFYRGYLQPRLESLWPPKTLVFGVAIGRGAILAAALFALGHFLGEWNPLRLGPFFPGLVFAWLRNATGTIAGAITYHALCNIFGEILFSLYGPL